MPSGVRKLFAALTKSNKDDTTTTATSKHSRRSILLRTQGNGSSQGPKHQVTKAQGIEALPPEILFLIFGHLSPRELRSFSACSRRAHNVSIYKMYSHISLNMARYDFEDQIMSPWVRHLERWSAFDLVKTITIRGRNWTHGPSYPGLPPTPLSGTYPPPDRRRVPVREAKIVHINSSYMDDYYLLVQFMGRLKQLEVINFYIQDVIPPDVLVAIIKNHVHCKVNLRGLTFSSGFTGAQDFIHLFEIPNLVSVSAAYDRSPSNEDDQVLLVKTLRLAASKATKLRHLELTTKNDWCFRNQWATRLEALLDENITPRSTLIDLESLSITKLQLRSPITDHPLPITIELPRVVNTSNLRTLKLSGFAIHDLRWAAANCNFTNLQELELKMNLEMEDGGLWHENTEAIQIFVTSLPPLSSLKLIRIGVPAQLFGILGHHKESLQSLTVLFHFDHFVGTEHYHVLKESQIREIAHDCPLLQSLELEVRRDLSSKEEKGIYESFGDFLHLQQLTLHIDCTPLRHLIDPMTRDNLRNSAFDETLARSIWTIIKEAKKGSMLEMLQLFPEGRSHINTMDLSQGRIYRCKPPAYFWLAAICRSYELCNTVESDWTTGVSVRQIPPPETVHREGPRTCNGGVSLVGMDNVEKKAIERIWNISTSVPGWEKGCTGVPFK